MFTGPTPSSDSEHFLHTATVPCFICSQISFPPPRLRIGSGGAFGFSWWFSANLKPFLAWVHGSASRRPRPPFLDVDCCFHPGPSFPRGAFRTSSFSELRENYAVVSEKSLLPCCVCRLARNETVHLFLGPFFRPENSPPLRGRGWRFLFPCSFILESFGSSVFFPFFPPFGMRSSRFFPAPVGGGRLPVLPEEADGPSGSLPVPAPEPSSREVLTLGSLALHFDIALAPPSSPTPMQWIAPTCPLRFNLSFKYSIVVFFSLTPPPFPSGLRSSGPQFSFFEKFIGLSESRAPRHALFSPFLFPPRGSRLWDFRSGFVRVLPSKTKPALSGSGMPPVVVDPAVRSCPQIVVAESFPGVDSTSSHCPNPGFRSFGDVRVFSVLRLYGGRPPWFKTQPLIPTSASPFPLNACTKTGSCIDPCLTLRPGNFHLPVVQEWLCTAPCP